MKTIKYLCKRLEHKQGLYLSKSGCFEWRNQDIIDEIIALDAEQRKLIKELKKPIDKLDKAFDAELQKIRAEKDTRIKELEAEVQRLEAKIYKLTSGY